MECCSKKKDIVRRMWTVGQVPILICNEITDGQCLRLVWKEN